MISCWAKLCSQFVTIEGGGRQVKNVAVADRKTRTINSKINMRKQEFVMIHLLNRLINMRKQEFVMIHLLNRLINMRKQEFVMIHLLNRLYIKHTIYAPVHLICVLVHKAHSIF